MKHCRVLKDGVVSQQVDGQSVECKAGDVLEVSKEAFEHLVAAGYAEPLKDDAPAKRKAEVPR